MKAYRVTDREGYSEFSVIVFAESAGKAKAAALGTDEFPMGDWSFTDMSARRVPELDPFYRGKYRMEWEDMEDRVVMVRYAHCYCHPDYVDLNDCKECKATEWCEQYERVKNGEGYLF